MENAGLMLPPDLIDTLGEPSKSSLKTSPDAAAVSDTPPTTPPSPPSVSFE